MTYDETIRGPAPAPHERELASPGDLDDLVLEAIGEADARGRDWPQPRRQAARQLGERLFRGRS